MSPPSSALFRVEDIPNAGRGVIATRDIPRNTQILQSGPPAAHVIFRQYRKEVCASCFHYDLGRTLPVRHPSTGKFFCSDACLKQWLEEEGEVGLQAWESLHAFVQARTKDVANSYDSLPDRGDKPTEEQIDQAWRDAENLVARTLSTGGNKKKKSPRPAHQPLDPDILAFLLSSILSHHHDPTTWSSHLSTLAQDPTPYRSTHDLTQHTLSDHHLTTLLPPALRPSCTPSTTHRTVAAASHNAFGIRSPDGAEYLGYALHPAASYFNHSCAPNVGKARVGAGWVFVAARDIVAGEECCITYLGGDEEEMGREERRGRLREHWGFGCMCVRCRGE